MVVAFLRDLDGQIFEKSFKFYIYSSEGFLQQHVLMLALSLIGKGRLRDHQPPHYLFSHVPTKIIILFASEFREGE